MKKMDNAAVAAYLRGVERGTEPNQGLGAAAWNLADRLEDLRDAAEGRLDGLSPELCERYVRGVYSPNERVRRHAVHLLAEADPYGRASAAAVAELLEDGEVRDAAERALAEFELRAGDSPDARARHRSEVRRIRGADM